jgi:hypothetical protein
MTNATEFAARIDQQILQVPDHSGREPFHSITIEDQPDAATALRNRTRRSSMSNQPRADILQRKSITTPRFVPISMSIAAPSGMKIALEKLGGWF